MANAAAKLTIGRINFTNVWPVDYYFPESRFGSDVRLINQVPSGLNKRMLEGSVDIGAISSFAYAASHDRYVLLPDLSVSAFGEVRSILLFYKDSFDRLLNGNIALTTASATSVNLLKIILEKFHGGSPSYFFAEPDLHDMMKDNDAALLIGDDAIKARWHNEQYRVLDLGEEWARLTGSWMTYAVWALRREAAEAHPQLIARIYEALLESKRKGAADKSGMISAAVARIGGEEQFWLDYFAGLNHDFSKAQQTGLELYYRYAAELGLLVGDVPLNVWDDNLRLRVNE